MRPISFPWLALVVLGCASSGGGRPGDRPPPPATGRCDSTIDSDGDGLLDEFEMSLDADGDGLANSLDVDSDGDGASDLDEAGDYGGCGATNSDGDAFPDYLDNDSDNDGLGDREERETYGTDPRVADTDGDGFDDTAEVVTGHDPIDALDRLSDEDFYVVLPYLAPAVVRDLRFRTNIQKADVFFAMDRTSSMRGESDTLVAGLAGLVESIRTEIPDVAIGFGGFADFPIEVNCRTVTRGREPPETICDADYGDVGDLPFVLHHVVTTDPILMDEAVRTLRADMGGQEWASSTETLFQIATGAGIAPWVPPQTCEDDPDDPGIPRGYPCFRPGAQPIVVMLTDTSCRRGTDVDLGEDYQDRFFPAGSAAHHVAETEAALRDLGARVFGVVSGAEIWYPTAAEQMTAWAAATGTVDRTGAPILFEIESDGTGLTEGVYDAIRELAGFTPMDVSTRTEDGVDFPPRAESVDATRFMKAIRPTLAFAIDGTELPLDRPRRDETTFYGVVPGTNVAFDVTFENDFVPPAASALVFRATIIVVGNRVTDLDSREVVIIVPTGSAPLI